MTPEIQLRLPTITAKTSRELLVEHLREAIVSGRYGADKPLPQERDLVLQTGLSRGSVREALRVLEAEGLITTRVGRTGGSTVAHPSQDLFKRQIYTFLQTHRLPLSQLFEVREAMEPKLALLAACNRSSEDLANIERTLSAMKSAAGRDVERFIAENSNWHLAVARASGNEMLCLLMEPVSVAVSNASEVALFQDIEVQNLILKAHIRIFEAIEAKDSETAARRMMRHVQAYPEKSR